MDTPPFPIHFPSLAVKLTLNYMASEDLGHSLSCQP